MTFDGSLYKFSFEMVCLQLQLMLMVHQLQYLGVVTQEEM